MNELIQSLLGDKIGPLVTLLTEKFDFDLAEAKAFVPASLSKIADVFGSGKVDLSGGLDPSALIEKLDIRALAEKVGIEEDKARSGLVGILPQVTDALSEKAGGLEGFAALLGGGESKDLLGSVGKLFGR